MQNQTRAGSRFDLTSLRLPDISINDTITFWKKYALLLPIAHQPTKPRILGFKAKTTSYRTKYPNHTTNLLATHLYSSSWASQVRKRYNGKSPTFSAFNKMQADLQKQHTTLFSFDTELFVQIRGRKTALIQQARPGEHFMSFESFKEIANALDISLCMVTI